MSNQQQVLHHDVEEATRRRSGFTTELQQQQPGAATSSSTSTNNNNNNNNTAAHHQRAPLSASASSISLGPLLHADATSNHSGGYKQQQQTELPPPSQGLPLTLKHLQQQPVDTELRLLHPLLRRIPLQFRFGFTGLLSNVLFMVAYNLAVGRFSHIYHPSTIYSLVYLLFIPLSHALVSLLVFGWPDKYCSSLMSNFPIGLTAIAIGGALTSYLDAVEFNGRIEDYIWSYRQFHNMPARTRIEARTQQRDEFYSGLVVLVVTSVWTYVLSVYINAPPTKSEKKEL